VANEDDEVVVHPCAQFCSVVSSTGIPPACLIQKIKPTKYVKRRKYLAPCLLIHRVLFRLVSTELLEGNSTLVPNTKHKKDG